MGPNTHGIERIDDGRGDGDRDAVDRAEVWDRLDRLEQRLSSVERVLAQASIATSLPPPPPPVSGDRVVAWPPPAESDHAGPETKAAEAVGRDLDAETMLKWTGVSLVSLAALFLVSTAVSRGWIGPRLQLSLATLGGAGLLAVALRLPADRRPWSVALAHGGLVVLGICAGAAHAWLDLVSLPVSTALVACVVGLAMVVADRLDHANLVSTGVVIALIVPAVITTYEAFGPAFTAPWLLGLVAVSITVSWWRDWWAPRLIALVTIGLPLVLVAGDASGSATGIRIVVQFSIVAAALLWWMAPWLRPAPGAHRWLDGRSVMVLPGLVWLASSILWFPGELAGLEWATSDRAGAVVERIGTASGSAAVAGLAAAGFAALAVAAWSGAIRPLSRVLVVGHLVGVSVVTTIGLALVIDGPALLLSLAVQTIGLAVLARHSRDRWVEANAAMLAAVVGAWTAAGIIIGIDEGLAWPYATSYLIVVAVAAGIALAARDVNRPVFDGVVLAAWVALLLWFMAVVGALPQGQMLVSLVWAALGAAVVAVGAGFTAPSITINPDDGIALRRLGLITLAATVVKLVTIDLAEVDTIWRALLFAVVGAGLLRLGFRLGSRQVPR